MARRVFATVDQAWEFAGFLDRDGYSWLATEVRVLVGLRLLDALWGVRD